MVACKVLIISDKVTNSDGDRIYMMFSATFPKGARELARDYMAKDHIRIRVGRPGSTTSNIKQRVCVYPCFAPISTS